MVNRIQQISGNNDPEYLEAFLLSAFHEHAVMAGYKYKMTQRLMDDKEDLTKMNASTAFNIWSSFEEIDYLSSVSAFIARNYGWELGKGSELVDLANCISEATVGKRIGWMFNQRYGRAVQIATHLRDRFGFEKVADAIRSGRLK